MFIKSVVSAVRWSSEQFEKLGTTEDFSENQE